MTTARSAVVVGGGIGGLSAAIALRRSGWQVIVLERAPEFGEVGAGITLMANALRGFDALGVGAMVREQGRVIAPGGIRTARGRWLSRVDGADLERDLGTGALGIHRATLHRLLRAALPASALVADARVVEVRPGPPAGLDYLHRGERVSVGADLVVGADGVRSTVRDRLWPETPPLTYSGSTAWRGVTEQRWAGESLVAITWGRGAEFGIVPLGDGRVSWYAAINAPPGGRAPDELAAVRAVFGDWAPPVPALLDATVAATVLRHDIHCLDTPLPDYVTGAVALLGDAAHPMTPNLGQGACQAIEDAVVLGVCCAPTGDLSAALRDYDRRRRPRTRQMARAARQIGRFGQQLENPLAVALRNTVIRLTPPRVALGSMAKHAAWHPPTFPVADPPPPTERPPGQAGR